MTSVDLCWDCIYCYGEMEDCAHGCINEFENRGKDCDEFESRKELGDRFVMGPLDISCNSDTDENGNFPKYSEPYILEEKDG